MPFGDQSGPMGEGPMSGRAAGYCAGFAVPGYMNAGAGFGRWGRRFRGFYGHGYGVRFGWGVPAFSGTREQELDLMKEQAEALKKNLNEIERRIEELEKSSD